MSPFSFSAVSILAYQGNNAQDLSDFNIATFADAGSFLTTGLPVGRTLSFDVTQPYNFALANGFSSLGFRLEGVDGAFNNFRLIAGPSAIPEPATMLLLGTGLAGVSAAVRRRRKTEE